MTEPYTELGGQPQPPIDLRTQFGAALPAHVKARVHPTSQIDTYLGQAVANGWTVAELAKECSRDLGTAANIGGIITSRLSWCAKTKHSTSHAGTAKPWCGMCDDPSTRWEVDADDNPVRHCRRCSPGAGAT